MKKKLISSLLFFTIIGISTSAVAHSLWVNLNESFDHPPGHAITSLGWGHSVPLDDFLASASGNVNIVRYDLVSPDNKISKIPLPVIKKEKILTAKSGMKIQAGDLGIRKISLTKKTEPGTWEVIVESGATYFTQYIDKKGKVKMATKPMDDIKGAKKFNFSCRYKATAKSFMGIEKWTTPKPAGHELELMPTCDLSNVHAGDMISFEATLKGKKLTCDMDGMNYLMATSNTYGGPDKFMLCSHLFDGKAQMRVPTAGQWVVSVMVRKEVKPDNELKELVKKCQIVYYGATISLSVKP